MRVVPAGDKATIKSKLEFESFARAFALPLWPGPNRYNYPRDNGWMDGVGDGGGGTQWGFVS